MSKIDFYKILRGHEGEEFYLSSIGKVRLVNVLATNSIEVQYDNMIIKLDNCTDSSGNIILFPSKENHDWDSWIKNNLVPKTWAEMVAAHRVIIDYAVLDNDGGEDYNWEDGKSALAYLKICQLINVGYGGTVKYDEWHYEGCYIIKPLDSEPCGFYITSDVQSSVGPLFHTYEQAKEFLKHPENIQLLKDYYRVRK